MSKILVSTQDEISGYQILQTYGLVRGNAVRSRNIARNIVASLRTIFGGEIPEYTKLIAESREQALIRMLKEAESHGANAVVAFRFITSDIGQACTEILAYGTAVKVESK